MKRKIRDNGQNQMIRDNAAAAVVKLYTFYDKVTLVHSPVMSFATEAAALRYFYKMIKASEYPQDWALYCHGSVTPQEGYKIPTAPLGEPEVSKDDLDEVTEQQKQVIEEINNAI